MEIELIFTGVIFAALCVVCVIGGVNLVRISRLGDRERRNRLLWSALVIGVMTFGLGWVLFSPGHNTRTGQIIMLVALALNAAFWFRAAFGAKPTPPGGEEETPPSLSN